jgi:hypothetical protein
MMFRKLYWVTEGVNADHDSMVLGVFTSIPDLIKHGLPTAENYPTYRISLVKLDAVQPPLGTWQSPDFSGLRDALQAYVVTDEFSADQCENLHRRVLEPIRA